MIKTKSVNGEAQVAAPFVRGVDPATESRVSDLPKSLVAGKFDLERNGLIVGTALADNLNLRVGDSVDASASGWAVRRVPELERVC
jgi:lipoprotein-releasing system permease protein